MGGTCDVCSSTKHEDKHACMAASRAAWLRELDDSSRMSWKGAFAVTLSAGTWCFRQNREARRQRLARYAFEVDNPSLDHTIAIVIVCYYIRMKRSWTVYRRIVSV